MTETPSFPSDVLILFMVSTHLKDPFACRSPSAVDKGVDLRGISASYWYAARDRLRDDRGLSSMDIVLNGSWLIEGFYRSCKARRVTRDDSALGGERQGAPPLFLTPLSSRREIEFREAPRVDKLRSSTP